MDLKTLKRYEEKTKIKKHQLYNTVNDQINLLKEFSHFEEIKKKNDTFNLILNDGLIKSVLNKEKLDYLYVKVCSNLYEILPTLDYNDKKRLINLDTMSEKESMLQFNSRRFERPIYVPFLDERFNDIYHQEMPLLDLKQYKLKLKEYGKNALNPLSYYGFDYLESEFINLINVYHDHNMRGYLSLDFNKIFIIDQDMNVIDIISIYDRYQKPEHKKQVDIIEIKAIMETYPSAEKIVQELFHYGYMSEKLFKKLDKKYKLKGEKDENICDPHLGVQGQ